MNTRDAAVAHYLGCRNTAATAREFGVTRETVRSWCRARGIDTAGRRMRPRPDPTPEQVRLIEGHLHLMETVVRQRGGRWRARRAGLELDDLYAAGRVGLWRAALAFDPRRGLAFSTLAVPAIVGEMLDAIDLARYGRRRRGRPLVDHSRMVSLDAITGET